MVSMVSSAARTVCSHDGVTCTCCPCDTAGDVPRTAPCNSTFVVVAPAGDPEQGACDNDVKAGLAQAQLMARRAGGGFERHIPTTRTDISSRIVDDIRHTQPQCLAFVGSVGADALDPDAQVGLCVGSGVWWSASDVMVALNEAGVTHLELLLLNGSYTIELVEAILKEVRVDGRCWGVRGGGDWGGGDVVACVGEVIVYCTVAVARRHSADGCPLCCRHTVSGSYGDHFHQRGDWMGHARATPCRRRVRGGAVEGHRQRLPDA